MKTNRAKKFWIKERNNGQTATYFVLCGRLFKKEARAKESTLAGFNVMHSFDTEEAYKARIAELKKAGEHVQ